MSSKAHRHHIFETKKQADKTLLMKEILTKFRDVLGHQDTRVSAIWTGQKRHRKKAGKSRVLLFATMWAKWHFSLNCLSCESPWLISLWFEFFKKKVLSPGLQQGWGKIVHRMESFYSCLEPQAFRHLNSKQKHCSRATECSPPTDFLKAVLLKES